MSNGDAILTCFGCFLGCLRPRLISVKNAKGADARGYVRSTYIRVAFVGNACV